MKNFKKTILITGAARRIGAVMAEYLHQNGYNIFLHCYNSVEEAQSLAEKLNALRENSVYVGVLDLKKINKFPELFQQVIDCFGRLDVLINNASVFYPTKLNDISETNECVWDDLMDCNAKAPFFLSQAAYLHLKATHGHIINITDIHAEQPLKNYGLYCMSKAALLAQTRGLAEEWGPEIRVNAVAPGAVIWPEGQNILDDSAKQKILNKTPLKKQVNPQSIAKAILFLLQNEDITGEVIHVSAGRTK